MSTTETIDFQALQADLRIKILGLYHQAHAGHIGCSLSCVDLMIATLVLRKREQDTFLLSKGHAAASLYACLNHIGDISDEELSTFYQNGTTLPAHPAPLKHRGIPFATGSLGHGLPIGSGIALANKMQGSDGRVFVLMSDGETNEGTTWEAAHFAIQHGLDNLIVLIDKNGLQGFGATADVMGDTANARVWENMGFRVIETDGHDVAGLLTIVDQLNDHDVVGGAGRPTIIIANTVKGKGISYMENRLEWHYLPMTAEQYEQACTEVSERYLPMQVDRE